MRPAYRARILIGAALTAATPSSIPARDASPRGLILSGSIAEGDSPSPFTQSIDLQTGHNKRTQRTGDAETQSGFDGEPWEESNGIVAVSNLPSAIALRRTLAWIDGQAWRERAPKGRLTRRVVPLGGNPVVLTFDARSGLPTKAVMEGDWGPVSFSYSDWRRIGAATYPFHREDLTPVGERTTLQVEVAELVPALPKTSLARPSPTPHAQALPGGSSTIDFLPAGAKKTHILVDAMVNERPARLAFDTGAANYLITASAPRFGVHVSGGVNLSGVGESSEVGGYATVDRIALGTAALRNETLVVGPSPFPAQTDKASSADGFTGFEFLAEYVTTIDYPARKIVFSTALPASRRALRVPFYNDGSHIYVKARVNGAEGFFGLDTGDGGTVTIFPAFAARTGLHGDSAAAKTTGGGVGGAVKSEPGILQRFSLGGLTFRQLPVRFTQNKTGAFASRSIAGNLGGGILQCFRITIDFPHHLLLLEPVPDSPVCAPGGTVRRS
jgi:predicted aspartyl protease